MAGLLEVGIHLSSWLIPSGRGAVGSVQRRRPRVGPHGRVHGASLCHAGRLRGGLRRRLAHSVTDRGEQAVNARRFSSIHPSDAPKVKRRRSRRLCCPLSMARSATRWAPVHDRPPWLCSALGSEQSLACSCPPRCALRRTPWCDDLVSSEPDRSCTAHCSSVPVATSIETMPDDLAGGSLDGRDPAEAGEGGLALQPLGVVFKATISSVAAWSVPMPGRETNSGAVSKTSRSSCTPSWAISSERTS